MKLSELEIPGCYGMQPSIHSDVRGLLVKVLSSAEFSRHGLEINFLETFYTISGTNVLRGMHLQIPPADHAKVVYCVAGSVMDVCLDVRRGSPSFGKHVTVDLSAARNNAIYLPRGIAHGFFVRESPAIMLYHVTSQHQPQFDTGIAWNSFGAQWPTDTPVLSARDAALPALRDFISPFRFSTPRDVMQELK